MIRMLFLDMPNCFRSNRAARYDIAVDAILDFQRSLGTLESVLELRCSIRDSIPVSIAQI